MAFCDGPTFVLYYDPYRVAEYVTDTTTGEPIDASAVPTNPVVLEMLNEATGEILQAARVGARYLDGQLDGLAGDPVNGGPLRKLCAVLAYALIVTRKGYNSRGVASLVPGYDSAMRMLDQIFQGERLFNTGPVLDPAGTAETAPYQPSPPNFPYSTQAANGYFGNTADRIYPGGAGPGPGYGRYGGNC